MCYEDIFADLARDQARAGAELLVVVTNDAWFGTGGGSLQHAAHSVLRAIETRRPVIRCGNEGWSGFIDQDGNAYQLEKEGKSILPKYVLFAKGSTYFRGTGAFVAYSNPQFDGQETFYVRHGDWFVALGPPCWPPGGGWFCAGRGGKQSLFTPSFFPLAFSPPPATLVPFPSCPTGGSGIFCVLTHDCHETA